VVAGGCISCPFHGAQFSLATGDIEDGPSFDKLPVYPAAVAADGFLYVDVPEHPAVGVAPEYAAPAAAAAGLEKMVIVGAGAASHAAIETLRSEGFSGSITVVTNDTVGYHHLDRTKLSKSLATGHEPRSVALRPRQWWADRNVTLRLGCHVKAIDDATGRVMLDGDGPVPFDRALVATGGRARRMVAGEGGPVLPGADLRGVLTCRDAPDAAAIHDAAAHAGASGKIVVIGGGFVGMEVAASVTSLFRDEPRAVTVVCSQSEPLQAAVGPELGASMRAVHEAHGVAFRRGKRAVKIRAGATGAVSAVELSDGEVLPAVVVVLAAGMIPNDGILRSVASAKFDAGGGVVVGPDMSVTPSVFAAGDVVAAPSFDGHGPARLEHWNSAISQGRVAARAMMGASGADARPPVPFFATGQFGVNIRVAGHARSWERVVVQGDLSVPKATCYFVTGDKVSCCCMAAGAQLLAGGPVFAGRPSCSASLGAAHSCSTVRLCDCPPSLVQPRRWSWWPRFRTTLRPWPPEKLCVLGVCPPLLRSRRQTALTLGCTSSRRERSRNGVSALVRHSRGIAARHPWVPTRVHRPPAEPGSGAFGMASSSRGRHGDGTDPSVFVMNNPLARGVHGLPGGSSRSLRRGPSRPNLDDQKEVRKRQAAAVPKLLRANRLEMSGAILPSADVEWRAPSKKAAIEHANSV